MLNPYFEDIIEKCTAASFLDRVRERYHYPVTERERLKEVAESVQACARAEALWSHEVTERVTCWGEAYSVVAMTLGKGVDALQENFLAQGLLSESYMIEVLGSEILLEGYKAYNRMVAENGDYHVSRFYFLDDIAGRGVREDRQNGKCGGNDDVPDLALHNLPGILKELNMPVTCNEAFCMTPKKSVVFYAALKKGAEGACPGICTACGSRNCPNRIKTPPQEAFRLADMIDRPLPYGYARIFGKQNRQ